MFNWKAAMRKNDTTVQSSDPNDEQCMQLGIGPLWAEIYRM